MALIPKVKLPRVALQRSTLQTPNTPNTPKFVKPKDRKRYISMLGVFLTLLDKWGRPQPDKPSIHSRRPLGVHLLPWLYHGNSYWRDRANQNLPKVQERTLRHRSNEHCRAVWRPHWPFMQKHLVRPQFATGFQKAPFGRRTIMGTCTRHNTFDTSFINTTWVHWCILYMIYTTYHNTTLTSSRKKKNKKPSQSRNLCVAEIDSNWHSPCLSLLCWQAEEVIGSHDLHIHCPLRYLPCRNLQHSHRSGLLSPDRPAHWLSSPSYWLAHPCLHIHAPTPGHDPLTPSGTGDFPLQTPHSI